MSGGANISVAIRDGMIIVDGAGEPRDLVALADTALTVARRLIDTNGGACACLGCKTVRDLQSSVARGVRAMGGTPASAYAAGPADAAPAAKPR